MPSLSQAEFTTLLRRAGLELPQAEISELYEGGFLPFTAMLENIRGTGARARAAEPATTFSVDDEA